MKPACPYGQTLADPTGEPACDPFSIPRKHAQEPWGYRRRECNTRLFDRCHSADAYQKLWSEFADLRVCPETSGGIAKFSEHEADRGEAQECERFAIKVLPILGESAAAVEPREGALDDPAFGQYDKSLGLI